MSPGRKPSRSPASTAGRDRMILSTAPADQHGHAHGHRQIGLAGAGRADAKAQLMVEQVLHIVLLRLGPRLHRLFAGAQFDSGR